MRPLRSGKEVIALKSAALLLDFSEDRARDEVLPVVPRSSHPPQKVVRLS